MARFFAVRERLLVGIPHKGAFRSSPREFNADAAGKHQKVAAKAAI
jgi:hypothetical protein